MAQMESYSIRVDKEVRDEANRVAQRLGTDLPNLTRMFYAQIAQTHAVPLNLSLESTLPQETRQALEEAKQIMASNDPGYASADDFLKSQGLI